MIEVVVVGGGLAGASTALALADLGFGVNLVEAERAGGGATGASAGMLAAQYESGCPGPLYTALVEARSFWREFAERLRGLTEMEIPVRWRGMLLANLTEDEERVASKMLEWQRASGQVAEIIGVDSASELQPGVTRRARSYLWLPDEGYVDTQILSSSLGAIIARAGVRLLQGTRVAKVRLLQDHVEGVAFTDGRTLEADVVVVCAGAWSRKLGGYRSRMPVRPVRGHLLRFREPPAQIDTIVAGHGGRYLVPREDGSILGGSTMDDVGFDRSLNEASIRAIQSGVAALMPRLSRRVPVEMWAGLRPIAADGLPFIGPDPEVSGLFHATGYGRNGILLSPLAGEVLARHIAGSNLPQGWEVFAPSRRRLQEIGVGAPVSVP